MGISEAEIKRFQEAIAEFNRTKPQPTAHNSWYTPKFTPVPACPCPTCGRCPDCGRSTYPYRVNFY